MQKKEFNKALFNLGLTYYQFRNLLKINPKASSKEINALSDQLEEYFYKALIEEEKYK